MWSFHVLVALRPFRQTADNSNNDNWKSAVFRMRFLYTERAKVCRISTNLWGLYNTTSEERPPIEQSPFYNKVMMLPNVMLHNKFYLCRAALVNSSHNLCLPKQCCSKKVVLYFLFNRFYWFIICGNYQQLTFLFLLYAFLAVLKITIITAYFRRTRIVVRTRFRTMSLH
jgi:hypothetical protein